MVRRVERVCGCAVWMERGRVETVYEAGQTLAYSVFQERTPAVCIVPQSVAVD